MTDNSRLGAVLKKSHVRFAAWSSAAQRMWVCVFDEQGEEEIARHEMRRDGDVFHASIEGLGSGTRYGFRADGRYDPAAGFWFDPDKLLVDPYATEIDRPYAHDDALAAPRGQGGDTAHLVPKGIVRGAKPARRAPPVFRPGGIVYELNVRGFTMQHPEVPKAERGTLSGLKHPSVIEHLRKIGVTAVELMPVTAWIDERHLVPLGLSNAWGYNPVTFMALDPRLAPGGVAELRDTAAALRKNGIGTILDLVFNHTGESDRFGPTLSLRGLDARAYYRHADNALVNDTGTGNTIACDHPAVHRLILNSLRHFVVHAGVDGFRFDLGTILGRSGHGFDAEAALLKAIGEDELLSDRVMIMEPWDIGADGYQLGNFRAPFLEWNDRYRDDVRRFWRGDPGNVGTLATRLSGSSDVFSNKGEKITRSVNFLAAHDGFTLADTVSFLEKHNEANGEGNRDGHGANFSWNNGVEGKTDDPKIVSARKRDARAMLATLFASRGTVMLAAGDEFGRTQNGNNNAYAQDNETTWVDWASRDVVLENHVADLATLRRRFADLERLDFFSGTADPDDGLDDVCWLTEAGEEMSVADWEDAGRRRLTMILAASGKRRRQRLAVALNGDRRSGVFRLPSREGWKWEMALTSSDEAARRIEQAVFSVPGRSVLFVEEIWVGNERSQG